MKAEKLYDLLEDASMDASAVLVQIEAVLNKHGDELDTVQKAKLTEMREHMERMERLFDWLEA